MLKYHYMTRRCELGDEERRLIDRELARLERQLVHFNPDLCHLTIDVEKHPERPEYQGSVRLFVLNRSLPACRNRGATPAALLRRAFKDLEEQLVRFKARLRREPSYARRRASRRPAEVLADRAELYEERELLDRALAGDRDAFGVLVQEDLPGLKDVIARELRLRGQRPRRETVQQIVTDVLAAGFRQLPNRPAHWSIGGWLMWLAQSAIRRAELEPFGLHGSLDQIGR